MPKLPRLTTETILQSLKRAEKKRSHYLAYKAAAVAFSVVLAVGLGISSVEICRCAFRSDPAGAAAQQPVMNLNELPRYLERAARTSTRKKLAERESAEMEAWAQK